MDAIDAEQVAGGVEEDVARLLDGVAHVHPAVPAGQVALEPAAVEVGAARAEHLGVGGHHALFERGDTDDDLEGRAWRIAALDRPVLQRPQLVGVERLPGGAVDARGERVGIVGRQAHQREHVAGGRLQHRRRAPVAVVAERLLGGPLHLRVEGHLDALALHRLGLVEGPHLAADAVDHHPAGAVLAHQHLVVGALEPRLADDRARGHAGVAHLLLAGLADVAEQVRAERLGGIAAGRHLLHDHVGQFEVEPPGGDRGHLRQRRVLDHDDRPVGRLTPVPLEVLAQFLLVAPHHLGQQVHRAVEVARVLAHDRDVERGPVLDQHLAVAVEDHPARRPQRQGALVVVLRHLAELGVLENLEVPEAAQQEGEQGDHGERAARRPAPAGAGGPPPRTCW